ncbi:CobW family GTP-binding protein [Paenibacillus thermoaerophilus]|uniref:CobW family GTP-binding protein n=1 Tax=Paenibacillus thermoaerophilus TaxID=1215385 RepID=A0ABW2V4H4_9BACL|nr:GTP-binding protein [Paenibacillus thermoaerophilus]TMV18465.1 GTP-binding protein [Paenibacillus thermoaerophilus]
MNGPIPIHLLTGFLGSGKTTLLKHLLDQCKTRGLTAAVVMNELGEVNLDGEALGEGVPMREMLNGCVCCTVRDNLAETLEELADEVRPDVIFVETTGVANPVELLDAVTELPIVERVRLKSVVTVVDGPRFLEMERRLGGAGRTAKLMRAQIKYANLLILNKTDLMDESSLAALEQMLDAINPAADKIAAVYGRVGFERLETLAAELAVKPKDAESGGGDRLPGDHECGEQCDHESHSRHHRREGEAHVHGSHGHLMVVTYRLDGPVNRVRFEQALRCLPAEVLRAKGIVRFDDTPGRVMFQYAYREPMFIRVNPLFSVPDVAVFIGERLPKDMLASLIEQAMA